MGCFSWGHSELCSCSRVGAASPFLLGLDFGVLDLQLAFCWLIRALGRAGMCGGGGRWVGVPLGVMCCPLCSHRCWVKHTHAQGKRNIKKSCLKIGFPGWKIAGADLGNFIKGKRGKAREELEGGEGGAQRLGKKNPP